MRTAFHQYLHNTHDYLIMSTFIVPNEEDHNAHARSNFTYYRSYILPQKGASNSPMIASRDSITISSRRSSSITTGARPPRGSITFGVTDYDRCTTTKGLDRIRQSIVESHYERRVTTKGWITIGSRRVDHITTEVRPPVQ